jgi:hypothetical protein
MTPPDTQEKRLSREREQELWNLFDQMRGRVSFDNFSQVSQWLQDHNEKLTVRELIHFQERRGNRGDMLFAPTWLSRFVAQLLCAQASTTLLDPVGGTGLWAASIAEQNPHFLMDVVCKNPIAKDVFTILDAELPKLHIGTFEEIRPQLSQKQYDAIVSFPSPNERGREVRVFSTSSGDVEIRDEPSLVTILEAAQLLQPKGKLFVLVPPSFNFTNISRKNTVRQNLERLNLHLTTLLRVRPGTFRFTGIPLDLVIIEPTCRDGLYVAEIPEKYEAQDYLIKQLTTYHLKSPAEQAGMSVAEVAAPYTTQEHLAQYPITIAPPDETGVQGRIVDPKTFRGFEVLVAEENARQMAQRMGLVEKPFSEVVTEVNQVQRRPEFVPCEEHPSAVYLPLREGIRATTSQTELPEGFKWYVQLIVDPEVALPEYLAHLFNTPLGYELRKATSQGYSIIRSTSRDSQKMILYLPPLADQHQIIEASRTIRILRSELEELEPRLWDQPRNTADILEALESINHEERFYDWLETLPFPLASTLRAYSTVDQTDKDKYERLLYFFESLAAFCATILMSACRSDPQIWEPAREKITRSLANQHLHPYRPTFGFWRVVLSVLSKDVRQRVNGKPEEKERCLNLFHLSTDEPLQVICSKDLVTILEQVNMYRNRWKGHGGAVTSNETNTRHGQIREQMDSFRQLFGTVFTKYELIKPGNPEVLEVLQKLIYRYPAERVMGSNPMLEQKTIELIEPAISDRLHCYDPNQRRALTLYPFFQLKETPQAACYFFNRVEEPTAYFVSYHPVTQSEIEDTEQSDAILKILDDFSA